jgi:hypothetical protein
MNAAAITQVADALDEPCAWGVRLGGTDALSPNVEDVTAFGVGRRRLAVDITTLLSSGSARAGRR